MHASSQPERTSSRSDGGSEGVSDPLERIANNPFHEPRSGSASAMRAQRALFFSGREVSGERLNRCRSKLLAHTEQEKNRKKEGNKEDRLLSE